MTAPRLRTARFSLSGFVVFFALSALIGCNGSTTSSAGGGPPLPCDVASILTAHCQECHSNPPQYAAPMPLVTYNDLHAIAPGDSHTQGTNLPVFQAIEQRIHDSAAMMPQPPNAPLDAADTATLDAWIAAGAPAAAAGAGACTAPTGDGGVSVPDGSVSTLSCTPDEHLAPGSPWTMPQATEDIYVCYGVELNLTQARQVIGMEPRVDNHKIVHHMLLFQADKAVSPTPAACNGTSLDWRIIYGWAPGGAAFALPPDVGFNEDSSTHYVVQIHYNNINGLSGQTDSTGFDLCSTDQLRPNIADVMAFGSMSFTIPAHATLDITCGLQVPAGLSTLHMFGAFPHMHELGTAIGTNQFPAGSAPPVPMGGQANWNFQAQGWYPISATVNPGDTVKTRCAWNNTTASDVSFGEYTEDEMCYSFTMYYPKITSSQWSWAAPALESKCVPTGSTPTTDAGTPSDAGSGGD